MNQVLPGLYISGIFELRMGAWAILKLYETRDDHPNPTQMGLETFDMAAPDGAGFAVAHLLQCEQIVREHVQTGRPLVVCCAAGRSRSATVIISYLMSTGKSFYEAYQMVKSVRPHIDPNLHLLAVLLERHGKTIVLSSLGLPL